MLMPLDSRRCCYAMPYFAADIFAAIDFAACCNADDALLYFR